MSLATCHDRLSALGLDFGETGSMRLSYTKYALDRKRVYDGMGSGVRTKGLSLGGVVTQGLKQADLYQITHDVRSDKMLIKPILHKLEVPVRAMIMPLRDQVVAGKIREAVRGLLMPVLPEGSIWLQDEALYHATLYHASSHVKPVHASAEVIAEEERSIRGVCSRTCPIHAVLDRVVITPTGVVVACWQVLPGGGEPALLRAALGEALPNAPPKEAQMVKEPAMLHTTIARLLQPPTAKGAAGAAAGSKAGDSGAAGGGRELRSVGTSGGTGAAGLRGKARALKTAEDGGVASLVGDTALGLGEGQSTGSESGASAGAGTLLGTRAGSSLPGRRRLLMEEVTSSGGIQVAETTESQSGGNKLVASIEDAVVVEAVDQISAMLCGLRAQFAEVWFIEEQDLLALALNGRYIRHPAELSCPASAAAAAA
ncbi:hypothetical protein HYH03_008279 [Edaphochlamys debaryana]|uniref:Uncharacterized protein n=1 Tax=Edaphochlamys debaryana TaxID=47281 RepID=A0A835Y1E4_9CHLO|nr:hypothetical protein HYH03_008279 [Edaphochlamys debaryana]|eukprot:KAG2493462.1 hypothetical protein HYH03_008279 [Edaphochlamys debaryana]